MTRQYVRFVVIAAFVAAAMGVAVFALTAERPEPREVQLVIRDMAFFVDGRPEANPAIEVVRGESVAFNIRNEDTGIVHDFEIPAWNVSTKRLRAGESERLVVTVPSAPGTAVYQCSPHAEMMSGSIRVR